jgi:hypothetical protein
VKAHLRYLSYVMRHKWFVLLGCLRYGVPIHQAIVHDWSKFLPSQWTPYVNQFYRDGAPKLRQGYFHNPDMGNVEFNAAWLRHCLDNKHHWQHYAMVGEGDFSVTVPMPERFVREMCADWSGAGRAQGFGGDPLPWYTTNRDKMTLHPLTRQRVESILGYQGGAS